MKWGIGDKKASLYRLPFFYQDIIIRHKDVHVELNRKLLNLKQKGILDAWDYEPKNIFAKKIRTINKKDNKYYINSQVEVEKWINKREDKPQMPYNISMVKYIHTQRDF